MFLFPLMFNKRQGHRVVQIENLFFLINDYIYQSKLLIIYTWKKNSSHAQRILTIYGNSLTINTVKRLMVDKLLCGGKREMTLVPNKQ